MLIKKLFSITTVYVWKISIGILLYAFFLKIVNSFINYMKNKLFKVLWIVYWTESKCLVLKPNTRKSFLIISWTPLVHHLLVD